MIKSYLKTAFRFLWKNKLFSFINILGLAIGTLCCLYIVLFVLDQYSYDKQYNDAKDIYRITSVAKLMGDRRVMASCSPPVAPAMLHDFGEVRQFTRVVELGAIGVNEHLLRYKEKSFYETDAVLADSTFFDVFTHHFIYGNAKGSLKSPYSVVLLKSTSEKLFGSADPVGREILIDNNNGKHNFTVSGVVDESLGHSHIQANLYISMNSGGIGEYVRTSNVWSGNNFVGSYVKLQPHVNVAALERKLPAFLNKYGADQLKKMGMEKQLFLEPVASIHTDTEYEGGLGKPVSASFLDVLLLIATLIQVIACINFMNLSTARASNRAKEVGVRKVIGAGRKDLVRQFLGESLLLSLIGVIIALPLLQLLLPYLDRITGTSVQLSLFHDYRLWVLLTGLVLVTGLVAGSYPAFYLSAFQAIKVIKGNFTSQISAVGIRRSLVIFQFVLAIVLGTGVIVIHSQLNYIKNKDLGFKKDQTLIFTIHTEDMRKRMPAFMSDLRQLPEVSVVSRANNYPSQPIFGDEPFHLAGGDVTTSKDIDNILTDEYYLKAVGIQLVSGRDFQAMDSAKVIINETAAKQLGLDPQKAPGTLLYSLINNMNPTGRTYEIVGVMKDYNYNSLHQELKPFLLRHEPENGSVTDVIVRVKSADYKALLGKVENVWRRNLPETPFEYFFLDAEVEKQYSTETTLSRIINAFTGMAILISCLGLFGLAAFSAEQRKKEIGIRKVLGASVTGIVQLLSVDFLKLVGVAFVIATPVAWWAMHKWLQGFVYRTTIQWWMFGLAGLLAIVVALCTVSTQAIRAAVANPIKGLRSE